MQGPPTEGRIFGLDLLRAVAIMSVLIGHGKSLLPEAVRWHYDLFLPDGVCLFFVLSGFLIGGILVRQAEQEGMRLRSITAFWTRRWLRTLPAYIIVLVLLVVSNELLVHTEHGASYLPYAFFLQNFAWPSPPFFIEAWSLSVEEWFYLLLPFGMIAGSLLMRGPVRSTLVFIGFGMILCCIGSRWYRFVQVHPSTFAEWDLLFKKQVITRADGLMFGVIGAVLQHNHREKWIGRKNALAIIGIALLLAHQVVESMQLTGFGMYMSVFSFTVTALGALLLLPYLSDMKQGKGSFAKWVTFISMISYSLYLLNLSLVKYTLLPQLSFTGLQGEALVLARLLTFWLGTFNLAVLLNKFVERPFMNLRKRF